MQADQPLGEHARRASRAYGAAADHYGLASLGFWDRFGAATVGRLPLEAGDRVLDLCCGAGASAIPAAHAVGPAGHVLGIDVAAPLLELARWSGPAACWPSRPGGPACSNRPIPISGSR
jgi:ubiquinone/menaquinone biosynthesis C-methylase UbiE